METTTPMRTMIGCNGNAIATMMMDGATVT